MRKEVAERLALIKRGQLQEEARAIGVSEEFISVLVDTFYVKVRANPDLGPVFNDVIGDNWGPHLAKMKLFWNTIALRTGQYKGNPMPVHKALKEARPEHFETWLVLFEETLNETARSAEVVNYFMGYAKSMGDRLSKAMFS